MRCRLKCGGELLIRQPGFPNRVNIRPLPDASIQQHLRKSVHVYALLRIVKTERSQYATDA